MLKITAKTPAGAANALHRFLRRKAREIGQNPDIEIQIWSPEESRRRTGWKCWQVCWEAGPFEWAVHLAGGASMFAGDGAPFPSESVRPQVDLQSEHWYVEPGWSFSMCFHGR